MSSATQTAPVCAMPGGTIAADKWIPVEFAQCLQCEAKIARECVLARIINAKQLGPTTQQIRAYCEHCGTMYEVKRELRGGVWQLIGNVEIVTDAKRKEGFLARIAHQRSIVQQKN